jgi:hypothetical protein
MPETLSPRINPSSNFTSLIKSACFAVENEIQPGIHVLGTDLTAYKNGWPGCSTGGGRRMSPDWLDGSCQDRNRRSKLVRYCSAPSVSN